MLTERTLKGNVNTTAWDEEYQERQGNDILSHVRLGLNWIVVIAHFMFISAI